MKYIVLNLALVFFFASCSETEINEKESSSQMALSIGNHLPIANANGKLYFEVDQFIDAFNSLEYEITAIDCVIELDEEGDYYLLYFVENESFDGISFSLFKDSEEDINIDLTSGVSIGITHTCSGDPCNSCELEGTLFGTKSCKCNQEGTDLKCNHSVSYGSDVGVDEIGLKLNELYGE